MTTIGNPVLESGEGAFARWLESELPRLPGAEDELFHRLWVQGLLRFSDTNAAIDEIDRTNARILTAAYRVRCTSMLVLPDARVHRPALLFATLLLRDWWDHRAGRRDPNPVLYFGSSVGIRDQLASVRIGGRGWKLSSVFQQSHTQRGAISAVPNGEAPMGGLPMVITVYSPSDAANILEECCPPWIAIDCADAYRLQWLDPLIERAEQHCVPVFAWSQNGLGYRGRLHTSPVNIQWPLICTWDDTPVTGLEDLLFRPTRSCAIDPLVMNGQGVDAYESGIVQSLHILSQLRAHGRLAEDAVAATWALVRKLQNISVPFPLHESEAPNFWGFGTVSSLKGAAERFATATRTSDPELASALSRAVAAADSSVEYLQQNDPPLWTALGSFCIEPPPEGIRRLVVFGSRAQMDVFLFALLARYGITQDDLSTLDIFVTDLTDLHRSGFPPEIANSDVRPLYVGVPSLNASAKVVDLLRHCKYIDFLIYTHQLSSLERRSDDWNQKLGLDAEAFQKSVTNLSGQHLIGTVPSPRALSGIASASRVDVLNARNRSAFRAHSQLQLSPVSEISNLFSDDDEDSGLDTVTLPGADTGQPRESPSDVLCDSAIAVDFESGWTALFAPNEKLNVITTGGTGQQKTEERVVAAVRPNDRVLLITGQRRQSLYDLIVGRVHRHPAFEMHLALIRRWQDDLVAAYDRWKAYGARNIDELLRQMVEKGSKLTSSFTLRTWLWRQTLCPDAPDDLRRIAEVLDMRFVAENYRRISRAADRLRNLHRSLALRLSHWLQNGQRDIDAAAAVVDADLGLTFNDFRDSLLVLKVVNLNIVAGPFLRSRLGIVEKRNS